MLRSNGGEMRLMKGNFKMGYGFFFLLEENCNEIINCKKQKPPKKKRERNDFFGIMCDMGLWLFKSFFCPFLMEKLIGFHLDLAGAFRKGI